MEFGLSFSLKMWMFPEDVWSLSYQRNHSSRQIRMECLFWGVYYFIYKTTMIQTCTFILTMLLLILMYYCLPNGFGRIFLISYFFPPLLNSSSLQGGQCFWDLCRIQLIRLTITILLILARTRFDVKLNPNSYGFFGFTKIGLFCILKAFSFWVTGTRCCWETLCE